MDSSPKLCPSAPLYEGSKLLGIVNEAGEVNLLTEPLPLTQAFTDSATQSEVLPEARFRFVNKCVKSGCGHWDGHSCGVIQHTLRHNADRLQDTLPECGIRPQCRWYAQEGENACRICPLVRYI